MLSSGDHTWFSALFQQMDGVEGKMPPPINPETGNANPLYLLWQYMRKKIDNPKVLCWF